MTSDNPNKNPFENFYGNRAREIRAYFGISRAQIVAELKVILYKKYCDFENGRCMPDNFPGWYVRMLIMWRCMM